MQARGLKKRIIEWASGVADRVADLRLAGREPGGLLALKYALADKLVFTKVKNAVGGRLRFFVSGGGPLAPALNRFFYSIGLMILEGYGLTETSPVSHCSPVVPDRIKLGSVGPPVPNTECMIVSPDTGDALGYGEEGEIWIRGPQVMKGYLGNPEATEASIDDDGWFRSGDVGRVDEEGYFFIVDRLKELIKYKGLQIAPAELEALLLTHPAILDAAVVPKPHDEAGEVPKAFVVLRSETTKDDIMAFVAERVAPYKRIREVEIVDQIPKSPTGKILRRLLR
jgi:long-subunit acyl-CoA synthetase (AMP-forming)